MILSVGCGVSSAEPGVIRLDKSPDVCPDVVWDLNCYPYPFADSVFDEILCKDVIEHLDDIVRPMEEFYRILKPSGVLKIWTPHFSCANSFIDPTHRWHLSYSSFEYFNKGHKYSYYSSCAFTANNTRLCFNNGILNKIASVIANIYPEKYEQTFSWIFPCWYIYVELQK